MSGRLSSEDLGLSVCLLPLLPGPLPGLLVVLPVLLGTYLAPGLVRDGGSPACDIEPEGLGLLPFGLGKAAVQLLALRRPLPVPLVLVPVLLSGFDVGRCGLHPGFGSTRGFGFLTFWLALADFLLDLGLFGVRMTKVLSKMRSLEPPACAGGQLWDLGSAAGS